MFIMKFIAYFFLSSQAWNFLYNFFLGPCYQGVSYLALIILNGYFSGKINFVLINLHKLLKLYLINTTLKKKSRLIWSLRWLSAGPTFFPDTFIITNVLIWVRFHPHNKKVMWGEIDSDKMDCQFCLKQNPMRISIKVLRVL